MASLQRLLLFSEFLENRLETTTMEMLRRMFRDFSTGNEHALVDFMRLGAMVVAVFPKERTDPQCLQVAARLLEEQLQTTESVLQPSDIDAFRYLSALVVAKHIMWMCDMFHEFCEAHDSSLREFVRRDTDPISVIPVDLQEAERSHASEMTPERARRREEHEENYLHVDEEAVQPGQRELNEGVTYCGVDENSNEASDDSEKRTQ